MPRPSPLDRVLQAAARLQALVPDAVLVGGTAAALHAGHRISLDDDRVVAELVERFDRVLAALEDSEGWVTARVKRPVLILGSLDGVETGIRNLVRRRPLEVETVRIGRRPLRAPTWAETLRIKAWLCVVRNATRDYIDVAALAARMGDEPAAAVLADIDQYYADQIGPGGLRISTQVAKQLAEPRPGDLSDVDLRAYRSLDRRWHDWGAVADACRRLAVRIVEEGLP